METAPLGNEYSTAKKEDPIEQQVEPGIKRMISNKTQIDAKEQEMMEKADKADAEERKQLKSKKDE